MSTISTSTKYEKSFYMDLRKIELSNFFVMEPESDLVRVLFGCASPSPLTSILLEMGRGEGRNCPSYYSFAPVPPFNVNLPPPPEKVKGDLN